MPSQFSALRELEKTLAHQALRTIHEHRMILPGERVMVACSGGADSTALLKLLLTLAPELGCVICVAHFNHQLRGADSDADEQFVRRLAEEHGLNFYVERADVRGIAARSRTNLEAA